MLGYHVKIRVTAQPASTVTTTTATTRKPARAAWTTNTYIPKSIFESLPSHTPRKTSRNHATLGSKRKDYRYGPIRIDWLDLNSSRPSFIAGEPKSSARGDTMDGVSTVSASTSGKEKDPRVRGEESFEFPASSNLTPPGGQIVSRFVPKPDQAKVDIDSPGQPHGSTNLPAGVVHIFRETPFRTDAETTDNGLAAGVTNTELGADDNTLAVLAVPSWMTPSDFLSFVEPAADGIVHLRMVRCVAGPPPLAWLRHSRAIRVSRDSVPNRSMVFVRFRDSTSSEEFAEAYNGKVFNSLEVSCSPSSTFPFLLICLFSPRSVTLFVFYRSRLIPKMSLPPPSRVSYHLMDPWSTSFLRARCASNEWIPPSLGW